MKEGNQPFNAQKALRVACLVLADLILINLSAFLALYIRFEFDLKLLCETEFLHNMLLYSGINSVCTILIFYILKLYNSLWEFAGVSELVRTAVGCFFSAVFYMVGMFMLHLTVPRSFPAIYMLVLCLLCGALRFAYRCARRTRVGLHSQGGKRTMLIGGGQAGAIVLREFQTSPRSENKVVCIIDDAPNKVGSYLRGVKIVGGRSSIPAMAEKYDVDEIVLAIPSASRQEKLQILSYCHDTSCTLRTLPGICQLANGEVRIEQIREVDIEDLLGRETVKIDLDEVAAYITGKTVLVTGGGGSIGSELCRQAAAQRPKRLIIFDIYEKTPTTSRWSCGARIRSWIWSCSSAPCATASASCRSLTVTGRISCVTRRRTSTCRSWRRRRLRRSRTTSSAHTTSRRRRIGSARSASSSFRPIRPSTPRMSWAHPSACAR